MKDQPLPPAPGAQSARTFGAMALLGPFAGGAWLLTTYQFWPSFWWFALGVPMLAGLGIWKYIAARRAWRRVPGQYQKPSALGIRFCLWGLLFDAIFMGIFIPAIWVDVVAGRDRYTVDEALKVPLTTLVEAYPGLMRANTQHQVVLDGLGALLDRTAAQGPDVWDHGRPLVDRHIQEVPPQAPEAVEAMARGKAKHLGQGVFVIAFPAKGHPGYLAAAACLKKSRFATGGPDSTIASKVVELPATP